MIEYKPVVENRVADALSRVVIDEELPKETALCAFSIQINELLELVRKEHVSNPKAVEVKKRISSSELYSDFNIKDGLIYCKNRLWVPEDSALITNNLNEYHSSLFGGHLGVEHTFHWIRNVFIWKGMSLSIKQFFDSTLPNLLKNEGAYNEASRLTYATTNSYGFYYGTT